MCKRYKVRPQIDIPVGIFQLSRVIELEIDIDRLRSPSAPCAAYRPCPPLTAFAPRRLCLLGARYARTPVAHAPCASAAPPCPPFGYVSLRVAVAPWHGLSAKSVGANAPTPRLRCCQPTAPASLRSPADCLHVAVTLQFGSDRRIRFPVDLDTDIYLVNLTPNTARRSQNRI